MWIVHRAPDPSRVKEPHISWKAFRGKSSNIHEIWYIGLTCLDFYVQAKKRKLTQQKKRKAHVIKQAAQEEVSKKRQREERRDRYREKAQQERSSGPRQYKKART